MHRVTPGFAMGLETVTNDATPDVHVCCLPRRSEPSYRAELQSVHDTTGGGGVGPGGKRRFQIALDMLVFNAKIQRLERTPNAD